MIIKDGKLICVDNSDVELLKSNPEKFWSKISSIGSRVFSNVDIDCLIIPEKIKEFDRYALQNSFIKKIVLPDNMTTLPYHAFYECYSLEEVKLPKNLKVVTTFAFADCINLKKVTLPETVELIGMNAFMNCNSLTSIEIPESVKEIALQTFYDCAGLERIYFSNSDLLNSSNTKLENYHYIWLDIKKKKFALSKQMPTDDDQVACFISLQDFYDTIPHFKNTGSITEVIKYEPYVKLLKRNKIMLPYLTLQDFANYRDFEKFINNTTFKFFKNEIGFDRFFECQRYSEMASLIAFAYCLGCFSKDKIVDKHGNQTDVYVAQKACSILKYMLDNQYVSLDDNYNYASTNYIVTLFNHRLDFNSTKPSTEFLKFITHYENKRYPNLDMLFEIEREHIGSLPKIMLDFETVKKFRTSISENGTPITIPWKDAINKYLTEKRYFGITDETMDIAREFAKHDIDDQTFEIAQRYRRMQLGTNIPHHILSKPLKEETIVESIERIQAEIEAKLIRGKDCLKEVYKKAFTYEFLDKYDPKNLIIGVYASCCATISGRLYGADIAKHTAISKDVQNIVIRNNNNEIIAKGSMYVAKNPSYAVLNDFELNEKYKIGEYGERPGYYLTSPNGPYSQTREKIFKAFLRGIRDFVKEYDRENPNDPIRKVAVGGGMNRLRVFCELFPEANEMLEVPSNYKFIDASDEQFILYNRNNELINEMLDKAISKNLLEIGRDDDEIR